MFTFFVGGVALPSRFATISVATADYNLFTAMGSNTDAIAVEVTINNAIDVYSTSTGTPAFDVGSGWHVDTTIKIINNGQILGQGGAGGVGGNSHNSPAAATGLVGGEALNLTRNVELDNTNGNIYGGGGGGGGGGGSYLNTSPCWGSGGGGGGGGACRSGNAGAGGAGGTQSCPSHPSTSSNGNSGSTVGGTGGAGGDSGNSLGGTGGTGGGYGLTGSTGTNGTGGTFRYNGAGGGASGKAVDLNSNVITWLGGNNASQVKGAVS